MFEGGSCFVLPRVMGLRLVARAMAVFTLASVGCRVQQRAGVAWCRVLDEGLQACGYLPVAVHGH